MRGINSLDEASNEGPVSESEEPKPVGRRSDGTWYNCTECSYRVKWRANLDFHIRRHHEHVSPFRCKLCGEGFASTISRSTHVQKVHEQKAK